MEPAPRPGKQLAQPLARQPDARTGHPESRRLPYGNRERPGPALHRSGQWNLDSDNPELQHLGHQGQRHPDLHRTRLETLGRRKNHPNRQKISRRAVAPNSRHLYKNDSTRLYHYNSAWLDYLFKTDSTLNEVYELGVFEYLPNGEREGNIPFFDFDTEPDIFYFEIPGNSGIFVLDNDGGAHTIPYQDLAITFIRGTEPTDNRFTIRDNAGNLYKFGSSAESREVTTATTHDNTNHTNTKTLTYNSTWHLDEIAPFSGEQVLFTYEAGTHANEITTRDWFQIGLYALKEGRYELLQFENDYTTATAAAPKFLRQITWSGGKVVFTYDGITSLKLSTTYQVLKNIATYATTRQTNDIHFDYSFSKTERSS